MRTSWYRSLGVGWVGTGRSPRGARWAAITMVLFLAVGVNVGVAQSSPVGVDVGLAESSPR